MDVWVKSACIKCSRKATIVKQNKKTVLVRYDNGNIERVHKDLILTEKP